MIEDNNVEDFISETGDIVVMSNRSENAFEIEYVDIKNIAIVQRIRKDEYNVEALTKSIKATGLLNPIVVGRLETEGAYILIDGFRRVLACVDAKMSVIPVIINNNISTNDMIILEALYNHSVQYSTKQKIDAIGYLEKEKGILNANIIEYLMMLDTGDYVKLKDVLDDGDDEIVGKLINGEYTILSAFKALEKRRKKESQEEKGIKQANKVYENREIQDEVGVGEDVDTGDKLSDSEAAELRGLIEGINTSKMSLDEMIKAGEEMKGFEPNVQDYRDREPLDKALRDSVLIRDGHKCQCCGLDGPEHKDMMDAHHIVEVYLGGSDHPDNLICICFICHKLIHKFGRGELYIRPLEELNDNEKDKFKKIVTLGMEIRKGMIEKGLTKNQLKKIDKADKIGRNKPGDNKQYAG